MKSLNLSFLILFINGTCLSQEKPETTFSSNSIYAEAFGQGFCWSLNYDRLINTESTFMNSFSVGVVYVPESLQFGDGTYAGIPVSFNWLLGKKSHHLELGIGLTLLMVKPYYYNFMTSYYAYLSPKISYRFQRPQGGLFFRASATAMVDLINVRIYKYQQGTFHHFSTMNDVVGLGYAIFPWPGLSIGYTFE